MQLFNTASCCSWQRNVCNMKHKHHNACYPTSVPCCSSYRYLYAHASPKSGSIFTALKPQLYNTCDNQKASFTVPTTPLPCSLYAQPRITYCVVIISTYTHIDFLLLCHSKQHIWVVFTFLESINTFGFPLWSWSEEDGFCPEDTRAWTLLHSFGHQCQSYILLSSSYFNPNGLQPVRNRNLQFGL